MAELLGEAFAFDDESGHGRSDNKRRIFTFRLLPMLFVLVWRLFHDASGQSVDHDDRRSRRIALDCDEGGGQVLNTAHCWRKSYALDVPQASDVNGRGKWDKSKAKNSRSIGVGLSGSVMRDHQSKLTFTKHVERGFQVSLWQGAGRKNVCLDCDGAAVKCAHKPL